MALSILDPHFRKGGKGVTHDFATSGKKIFRRGRGVPSWGKDPLNSIWRAPIAPIGKG